MRALVRMMPMPTNVFFCICTVTEAPPRVCGSVPRLVLAFPIRLPLCHWLPDSDLERPLHPTFLPIADRVGKPPSTLTQECLNR